MSRLHGTWQAEGGGGAVSGPLLVGVVVAVFVAGSGAAAVEAAATLILAIAVAAAAVTVAGLIAALVLLCRYGRHGAEQFAMQAEAMRASQPVRQVAARDTATVGTPDGQVAAPAPQVIVNHFHGGTHIHAAVPLGIAEDGRTIQAIPLQRDAITITKE